MRAAQDTRCPQGFGRREGNFPTWIPKTDDERIQNLADWPEKLKGILWEVTEKKDSSSMTVFWSLANRADNTFGVCSTIRHFGWIASRANRLDNPFGECSRNFELRHDETNAWW